MRRRPDAAHPERGELVDGRCSGTHEHVHRRGHGLDDRFDLGRVREARRVQDVGACPFEGLKARDRVVEVLATVQVVLAARGQHEAGRSSVSDLGRRGNALGGERRLVDRILAAAGEVLDREAGQSRGDRAHGRLGDLIRGVRKTALEIGGHRQRSRSGD
jgi:hypothetical protein